jgi:hypothetical protein
MRNIENKIYEREIKIFREFKPRTSELKKV